MKTIKEINPIKEMNPHIEGYEVEFPSKVNNRKLKTVFTKIRSGHFDDEKADWIILLEFPSVKKLAASLSDIANFVDDSTLDAIRVDKNVMMITFGSEHVYKTDFSIKEIAESIVAAINPANSGITPTSFQFDPEEKKVRIELENVEHSFLGRLILRIWPGAKLKLIALVGKGIIELATVIKMLLK